MDTNFTTSIYLEDVIIFSCGAEVLVTAGIVLNSYSSALHCHKPIFQPVILMDE